MEIKKLTIKEILFWGIPILLIIILFVMALMAYLDYSKFDIYQKEIRAQKFGLKDLNLLKKKISLKRIRLDSLRRNVRLDFRLSDLKSDIEQAAIKSGISINKLAIIDFKVRTINKDTDLFLLKLSIDARFRSLGAFVARLERVGLGSNGGFNYLVKIKKLDFAVKKTSSAELRSRLELSVMRRRF